MDRDNAVDRLEQNYQTLQFLDESTDDYLFLADLVEERIRMASAWITVRYGIQLDEKLSCSFEDWDAFIYGRDKNVWRHAVRKAKKSTQDEWNLEYRLIDRKDNLVWISSKGKILRDEDGTPHYIIGRISDTALIESADSLTGLFWFDRLYKSLKQSVESEKSGVFLLLGADRFQDINAKYGRGYGDCVLKKMAELVEANVETKYQVFRSGGDCFGVNLTGYTMEQCKELFRRIQESVASLSTFSGGAVEYPMEGINDAGILYTYAERSLQRAKKNGRNRLEIFSEEEYHKQLNTIELTEELRDSVRNGCDRFYLVYQPQIAMNRYEVVGAEALLRFRSHYHGEVSPGQFIPILETTGMIIPVGNWVLKEAIARCAEWRKSNPNLRMSINLSYIQLEQDELSDYIYGLLEQYQLPGDAIILELTESMQLQDYTKYNQLFYQWNKRGIQISMDDFGTGYSSLGYLKSLAIDEIKIDRCFVDHIHMSAYNYRLLSNILELARSSSIRVVCEGVETVDELKTLAELAPEELQGFYFSKPLSVDDFTKQYIATHEKEENWKKQSEEIYQHFVEPEQNNDYKALLEQIDEVVYVMDMDSYELYYMNNLAKRLTGAIDYAGRKCYEVIEGRTAPCEDCCREQLRGKHPMIRWDHNKFLKSDMLMEDKVITWNGKPAHLRLGIDISHLQK